MNEFFFNFDGHYLKKSLKSWIEFEIILELFLKYYRWKYFKINTWSFVQDY